MLGDFKRFLEKKPNEKIEIEKYKRLLRENPEQPPMLHVKLGKLYKKIGDKKSAKQEFLIAARLYSDAENITEAIAANKLIVQLDPKDKDALAALAYLQFQKGDKFTAKKVEAFFHEIEGLEEAQGDTVVIESQKTRSIARRDESHEEISRVHKKPLLDLAKENAKAADVIISRLRQIPLFAKLSHADLRQLKEHAIVWNCPQNTLIIKEDEKRQPLFIILDGSVDIVENYEEKQDTLLDTLEAGDYFGKTSFFGQGDVQLSAITQSPCVLLEIPGDIMLSFAQKRAHVAKLLKKYCQWWLFCPTLAHVPLFKYLNPKEQQKIAENLFLMNIKKGTTIISEGEIDESIYLIKSGEAEVYTTLVEREEIQVIQAAQERLYLATLKEGDFFGEGAFLTKEPRGATVSALTDIQLIKLPKYSLENIIKEYPGVKMILTECYQQRTTDTMKIIQSTL